MGGYISWLLTVPALFLMITGRLFTPRGLFEIPTESFYVRCAGFAFLVAAFVLHLDPMFGVVGVGIALILLVVAIVLGVREMARRGPHEWRF